MPVSGNRHFDRSMLYSAVTPAVQASVPVGDNSFIRQTLAADPRALDYLTNTFLVGFRGAWKPHSALKRPACVTGSRSVFTPPLAFANLSALHEAPSSDHHGLESAGGYRLHRCCSAETALRAK